MDYNITLSAGGDAGLAWTVARANDKLSRADSNAMPWTSAGYLQDQVTRLCETYRLQALDAVTAAALAAIPIDVQLATAAAHGATIDPALLTP